MKTKLPCIPTIFTIISIIILLGLGSWQVQRLLWKNNLVTQITERLALPPMNLSGNVTDTQNLQYRKVIVTGQFLHELEIHLFTGAREMRGDTGYNIITPLLRPDGSFVLVDRGWVPAAKKNQQTRPETLLQGEVSVIGMIHNGERQATFTPNNDSAKNLWFWIDIPAIASFTGKSFDNVYVRALLSESGSESLPIAGNSQIELRNDHLQYAIIWYSFAVTLLIIYIIFVRGKRKK